MATKIREEGLLGLATAEKLMAVRYPELGLSRHQLRRLCMNRVIPCKALPAGRRVRYMVRVDEVAAALYEL